MKNLPTVTTPRLLLRPMCFSDRAELFEMLSDAPTAWWADLPVMDSVGEATCMIGWANRDPLIDQYGICEKGSDRVIGFIQVKHPGFIGEPGVSELGYVLHRDFRGKGYMTEAVRAVCGMVFFEEDVREITLEILPDNPRSVGVARKAGFVLEREPDSERDTRYLDGRLLDRYVLTRERFTRPEAA